MINFDELDEVLKGLAAAQEADSDMRVEIREAHHFIDKKDGQWEPEIVSTQFKSKPRYTFDKTSPKVDQVAGEMENAAFSLRVRPAGGEASKETAKTFDGLIRNIRNISNAENVFNSAGRSMITGGMDGWEIVQDWLDADAFDQDLFIRKIANFYDRVWFDPASEEQDHSDAKWVIVLQTVLFSDFDDQFPDKTPLSVGEDRDHNVYHDKPDFVITGRIIYKKPTKIEIVRMTNGAVYEDNADFKAVKNELFQNGIAIEVDEKGEEKRRIRDGWRCHSRLFSGDDWLTDSEETVFDFLPIVATYGNFKIVEDKRIVSGIVKKLMDPQRVHNYASSRQIEEGALAPREKIMMTRAQGAGNMHTLATMNINTDPVQFYTHDDNMSVPPPFKIGGATINPSLQLIAQQTAADIDATSGLFTSNMGDNPGLQSGIAIDRQISKGDNGTIKWFKSQEVAICYTGKILINAIPRVYDATRQVRILQEDGSFEMLTLNQTIPDNESQENKVLNDLSVGDYDVVCETGPAFKSKQRESAAAFIEMAAIDPSIIGIAQDVLLNNLDAPGMDAVAQRSRALMLQQGVIPQDQMTDEELEQLRAQQEAQANEPLPEDPNAVLAQAEMVKGQAEMLNAQNKQTEVQGAQQLKAAQLQLDSKALDLDTQKFLKGQDDKFNVAAAQIDQGQQKIDQDKLKLQMEANSQRFEQMLALEKQEKAELMAAVKALVEIQKAAQGPVIGPGLLKNVKEQSDIVTKEQKTSESS